MSPIRGPFVVVASALKSTAPVYHRFRDCRVLTRRGRRPTGALAQVEMAPRFEACCWFCERRAREKK